MVVDSAPSTRTAAALADVLAEPTRVRSVFQPLVDLATGMVLGWEALARIPGFDDVSPLSVVEAARRRGRLGQLDSAFRTAALRAAFDADFPQGAVLFVNVEIATWRFDIPEGQLTDIRHAQGSGLRVVLELTERALLDNPARLLADVAWARGSGCGIALDDVGSNPESLTVMPLVSPDVVKLDTTFVTNDVLSPGQAATLETVHNYIESRAGAVLVAEGIATRDTVDRARAIGATVGQGNHLGPPATALDRRRVHVEPRAPRPARHLPTRIQIGSPAWDALAVPSDLFSGLPTAVASKDVLNSLSRTIERRADAVGDPMMVVAAFQSMRWFTPTLADRYARFAEQANFVAVLGVDFPTTPAANVRGVPLSPTDPMAEEWTIVVISPFYSAALIGREIDAPTIDNDDRWFEYALTHDPQRVAAAARCLMSRIEQPSETAEPRIGV